VSEKNNISALQKHFEKYSNHPGWVTHLYTFALGQQLSVVLVNRHHKMRLKSELLTDLLALHKIRKKVDATYT